MNALHVLLQRILELSSEPYWGTRDNLPPPDVPPCGFFNEYCPPDHTRKPPLSTAPPQPPPPPPDHTRKPPLNWKHLDAR